MATLIYKTDFENITKVNNNHLSIPLSHEFGFGNVPAGARMWIETGGLASNSPPYAHSGTKCVGTEVSTSDRMEFLFWAIRSLTTTKELYFSIWIYLPSEWVIPPSHWASMGQPYQGHKAPYNPCSEVIAENWDGYDRVIVGINMNGNPPPAPKPIKVGEARMSLPAGRWFKFAYYIFFDAVAGKEKVWVDGNLICDVGNLDTAGGGASGVPAGAALCSIPAKIYGFEAAYTTRLWFDDLEIWNGIPTVASYTLAVASSPLSGVPFTLQKV